MFKRILCAVLCVLIPLSLTLCLGGCSSADGNFPVTVGHTKIKEKPENVAVLSDNLADIIHYLGYSTQICALSDACTQEELTRYISSVGSETQPDTQAIIASGADYVLTDKALSEDTIQTLTENEIEVITMLTPTSEEQLASLYRTLGTFFGGSVDGTTIGEASYTSLISSLEQAEAEVSGESVVKLFCYLYIDENGNLCSFNETQSEGMFLNYLCATNVSAKFTEEKVEQNILKLSNPDFIFYDNDEVLEYLKESTALSGVSAVKNNNTYLLPQSSLQRQGRSMLDTQLFMLSKMFPESISEGATGESLASQYGITFDEDTVFEPQSEHADIKIIQQRLIDLGYLVLPEGEETVDYYGIKTEEAVKNFQSSNGLEATGTADYETLSVLFMSSTLSTSGTTYIPSAITTPTESATETEPEPSEPATESAGSTSAGDYDIDLSEYKTYDMSSENNSEIKAINQRLSDLGYLDLGSEEPSEEYDWRTSEAVAAFQEANGLTATGGCDYATLKALFGVQ